MFGGIGMPELFVLGIISVLLFGSRLPEVAKTLGGSYQQFRKGIFDFQSTMNSSVDEPSKPSKSTAKRSADYDDYEAATAPKFVPPSAAPTPSSDSSDTDE